MKLYIVVLGCPKNEADFSLFKFYIEKLGHNIVEDINEADGVVIDTCGFILDAKRESIETILEFLQRKKENPNFKVFAMGCLVQRYADELIKEIPEVDGWFGILPPLTVAENLGKVNKLIVEPLVDYTFEGRIDNKLSFSYVKIADGCDRSCTFCTIPQFKGSFVSRKIDDIVNEVKFLVQEGKKEIILVAQDTTAYGIDLYGKQALPELLKKLNSLDGDFWIRVMYMHPDHITDEIIDAFSCEKVLKYFDIPIQHGSEKILKLMGRSRTPTELEKLFEKIRTKYEDAVLRTSIIVGFPGETNSEFKEMIDFVTSIEFDKLGGFVYSDEESALSYNLPGKVSQKTAKKRLDELIEVQSQISLVRNERYVGKTIDVLFDEEVDGVLVGRGYMDAPEIDGNIFVESPGYVPKGFCKVKITGTDTYDLEGELL